MLVRSVSSQAILIIKYRCKFTIEHICSMPGRGSQVNAYYTGASTPIAVLHGYDDECRDAQGAILNVQR